MNSPEATPVPDDARNDSPAGRGLRRLRDAAAGAGPQVGVLGPASFGDDFEVIEVKVPPGDTGASRKGGVRVRFDADGNPIPVGVAADIGPGVGRAGSARVGGDGTVVVYGEDGKVASVQRPGRPPLEINKGGDAPAPRRP